MLPRLHRVLIILWLSNGILPVMAAPSGTLPDPLPHQQSAKLAAPASANQTAVPHRYFVRFRADSAAALSVKQAASSASVRPLSQLARDVAARQGHVVNSIKTSLPDLQMHASFQVLTNGIEVSATEEQLSRLKKNPLVSAVYPVRVRQALLDSSRELINAPSAWQQLGGEQTAGNGVRIAIVDTGIRSNNPMFDDAGMAPPDLPDSLTANPDYCRAANGDPGFCNNKVILARWMDPEAAGMELYENEYRSPMDFDGHGTHVAGIAAGRPLTTEHRGTQVQIGGVAPGSYLMIYKALFVTADGMAMGTDTMLLQALEQAILDGAHVINNSWGASFGEAPEDSIFFEALNRAQELGIVVVTAAGNDLHAGRGTTINCPACIESGIAVANTTHGRYFGHRVTLDGQQYMAYPPVDAPLQASLNLPLHTLNSINPIDDDGCGEPLTTPVFENAAVMVDYRHMCTLEQVAQMVQSAGGAMVIIYQSGVFGMATYEPFIPYAGEFVIPIVGVSRTTGLQLFEKAHSGNHNISLSSSISAAVEPQFADMVHPFSSTGPNNNPSYLKPDMAAPGTHILSAYSPEVYQPGPPLPAQATGISDPYFELLTGTSMASPHVAGAAALLRQKYPDWTAKQIKSALVNTANPDVKSGDMQARPFDMGAGRLDLAQAIEARLAADPVSFSDPSCVYRCQFQVELQNLEDVEATWQAQLSFADPSVSGQLETEQLTLAPKGQQGSSAQFTFTAGTALAEPAKWYFGWVTLSSAEQQMRLPIALYANDSSDEGRLSVTSLSPSSTPDEAVNFVVKLRNKQMQEAPRLTLDLPVNAAYVQDSLSIEIERGETLSTHYDADNHQLQWQGELQQGKMFLQTDGGPSAVSLKELGVSPVLCTEGCVHTVTLVDFPYSYNGQTYDKLTVTDNGFVVAGEAAVGQFTALFNQNLPQPGSLNNVIAPFWTEFDLADPQLDEDRGGGQLFVSTQPLDGREYLIVEWNQVRLYQNDVDVVTEDPFTFQLLIEKDTDHIYFRYLDIPDLPATLSIGAENEDGSSGVGRYFDGQGDGIAIGNQEQTLRLLTEPQGRAEMNFAVIPQGPQSFTREDIFELPKEQQSLLDVLANDDAALTLSVVARLQSGQQDQAQETVILPAAALQEDSLTVLTQPSHGHATVEQGQIRYIPQAGFTGQDNLTYRVTDQQGLVSTATSVRLDVINPNQAPQLVAPARLQASENQTVTLSVSASDQEDDSLAYQWQQTLGPSVSFTASDNSISFRTPEVGNPTLIAFEVSANDGTSDSNKVTAEVQVNPAQTGGSGGGGSLRLFVLLWLGLMLMIRARR
ncbi:S8 family serine peptidase [Bowmanella dokdonensis]|uniref:S8 family serine peptidase n=1 Tax=Bowmanella dokdonensis TaxID=751969 RepID=A0A939DLW1_9ALTE|nr:S8 family serine peptidase [Bowmanella dokdonensis]MBN7825153.1 S8 family serine peptidase [Bowmanella dokdonensis]